MDVTFPDYPRTTRQDLDDQAIFMIGLIVRWWAMVDFTIDSSIRDLLNRPDTRHLDTSLKLPFKQRLELLKGLCAQVTHDHETLEKINVVIKRVGSHQYIRDVLTHGFVVRDTNRPDTHLYVSRLTWSWPIRRQQHYIARKWLQQFEQRLAKDVMKLFMVTTGCHDPHSWPSSHDISAILDRTP